MKILENIPKDFDHEAYLKYNPDLISKGINTEALAKQHYLVFGHQEQRIYREHILIENIDKDFDYVFYAEEYPDTRSYFQSVVNISQIQKLYHHYYNYGKYEGRFKNQLEKNNYLVDADTVLSSGIKSDDLHYIDNKLESICLLTTDQEILNGSYQRFIKRLLDNTKSLKEYKTIDFNIIINNFSNQSIEVTDLNKIFNNVEIIDLDLDKSEDCYIKHVYNSIKIPKYGLKSGPNTSFFRTIRWCQKYNTSLFLETDCILSPKWLTKIINYTKYANGFLISGAMYDGLVLTKADSPMRTHINGGTALYATSNKILQELIIMLGEFIEKQVVNNIPGLAYDYALKLLIDHNVNNTLNEPLEKDIWQFIHRNYLHCKAIINCSSPTDSLIDEKTLYTKYQYAILHKKQNHEIRN